ncbi:hypothetical protein MUN81_13720 [Hymenobacter sp. 5317J-9]|uniref:hypothetical protein n=1 Tax=Hymenobacter sp. 5317J-9 TaxID=2932250 RepID=UPI001FD69BF1|nr:hypothetical protein [Hymenobacter sp. 5317J-9]UOQ96307.1 hypothetical protein MUN81_13720 [Hymenobacter sp. 5317J-9]
MKILTSRWVTFPTLLILGFAAGFICAGYGWSKSGYQFVPSEIIVKPPPPGTTWCFPDVGFSRAAQFKEKLEKRMLTAQLHQYSDSIIRSSANGINADSLCSYYLMNVGPKRFNVIFSAKGSFAPTDKYTLVTETGCYFLYPIPKRRSKDYNSLLQNWAER